MLIHFNYLQQHFMSLMFIFRMKFYIILHLENSLFIIICFRLISSFLIVKFLLGGLIHSHLPHILADNIIDRAITGMTAELNDNLWERELQRPSCG